MQNNFGVERGRISDFGGDGLLRPKPWSRPCFSKPFAHFSAQKRRFGTVTRADGEMAWALVSGATFRRFDSSPAPRRADVLETGDIGGSRVTWKNLGGLTCYSGAPLADSVLCLGGLTC